MSDRTTRHRVRARFIATAVGIAVVGAAGYVGFVAFVGSERDLSAGVMMLAAATGFAAFFSPCSFPLLLTFLARRAADTHSGALLSAVRVGAGAALLLTVIGTAMIAGGTALGDVVAFDGTPGRVFRSGVGLLLFSFGLYQARLIRLRMRWPDRMAASAARVLDPARISQPSGRDVVYGFGYLLVGFG